MKQSLGPKTLAFVTPVWLIGTYSQSGAPNIMTASWGGICCSQPPCVTVSLRPATLSYGNIRRKKAFTVNVPSSEYMAQADFAGLASGRAANKFDILSLTAVASELVDAPYVQQCPLVLECRLYKEFELGRHTQFVGEILDVKADDSVLNEAGLPDVEKVRPFTFSPGQDLYHALGACIGRAFSAGDQFRQK